MLHPISRGRQGGKQRETIGQQGNMGQALKLKRCDLQVPENNQAHHTGPISSSRLVVRRGQPFTITLHFLQPMREPLQQMQKTWLVVQTGHRPSETAMSLAQFPISRLDNPTGWKATLDAPKALSWTLTVTSPATAAVGHYTLLLRLPGLGKRTQRLLGTFTLLFNPWCPDDSVFLPGEAQRQEYVCNQDGSIYWGVEEEPLRQPWDFGQFEEDIVDLSLALLDISLIYCQNSPSSQHGDPVQVCRLVSAMLNSKMHRAILEGRWTGDYSNGTPPFKWEGSANILRQWLADQGRPVRYGQCWVFAAVVCTVLRSIGIPTRVVTCFSSAQDTGGTLQVDEYFDEGGAQIPGNKAASIWPFHAWNECWMLRRDLPPGYDGWQALDATPQELNSGSPASCCGPAPVRAIKEGHLDLPHDVTAFFAAANAKRTAWVRQANGDFARAALGPQYVGNTVSTKGLGGERCEDLTQHYKYPEGSAQERAVLDRVCQALARSQAPLSQVPLPHPATLLDQEVPLLFAALQAERCLLLGQEAKISVRVANRTGRERSVQLLMGAQPLQYDGKALEQFWRKELCFMIPDGHEEALSITLTHADYGPALCPGHFLKLTALLRDSEAAPKGGHLAWQEVCFHAPQLSIQVPSRVPQFQRIEAEILVHNPLPEPLNGCTVSVSGRGLIHRKRHYRLATIPAGSTTQLTVPFAATQAGSRRLLAQAESGPLQSLRGCRAIEVQAA